MTKISLNISIRRCCRACVGCINYQPAAQPWYKVVISADLGRKFEQNMLIDEVKANFPDVVIDEKPLCVCNMGDTKDSPVYGESRHLKQLPKWKANHEATMKWLSRNR